MDRNTDDADNADFHGLFLNTPLSILAVFLRKQTLKEKIRVIRESRVKKNP
jgi:hypothetical protein